jgi:lipoprotein-anchoring transpeptidase ErfK/SrfK
MHSTLRNAAAALAAALVLGLAGGCATAGPVSARPAAASDGHLSAATTATTAASITAVAPTTTPTTTQATTTPPTTPPTTPAPVATTTHSSANTVSNASDISSISLAAEGVPCQATAIACVSLSKQEAWLLRDGKVVYGPVRVATGRSGLATPAGIFHVYYKVRDSWSAPYQSWMPWAAYFYKGDAFHEDPVTVRSHGCVHLSATNAEYFYDYLHIGDEVQVAY